MADPIFLPEIKKRKIGIEELQKQLYWKRLQGEKAEIFILEFEKLRLNSEKKPEWVSPYWVNAGYDIASYEDTASKEINRFIEVKSFSGTPTFYWSRNEMDVAKLKREKYFLYLVDMNKIDEDGYNPIIIQNPYDTVLKNDRNWSKLVDKYFITFQK